MKKQCQCIACDVKRYYEDVQKTEKKSCNSTSCKCDKANKALPVKENQLSVKNYRITLTDTGTTDGYFTQYSKEITVFDFVNLLSEHFGVNVSIDYEEDYDLSVVKESSES